MNIFILLQYFLTYIIVTCLCSEQFINKELDTICKYRKPSELEPIRLINNKEEWWNISYYKEPEAIIIETNDGSEYEINYSILIEIKQLYLNSKNGDFLLIKSGNNVDQDSGAGKVFTYFLTKPRKYLFHSNSVYISLHVCEENKENETEIILTYQRIGEEPLLPTEPPPTSVTWPTPSPSESNYFIGNLSGKTLLDFTRKNNIDDFKNAMVGSSKEYCNSHKVELTEEITIRNVLIHHIVQCPYSWPNSHLCTQVNFSLPILYKTHSVWTGYQMNSKRLEDMWINYAGSFLDKYNMEIYAVPDNTASYMKWIAISCSILAVLLILPCIVSAVTKKFSPEKNTSLFSNSTTDLIKSSLPSLPKHLYESTPPIFEHQDDFDPYDFENPKPKHEDEMDWFTDDIIEDETIFSQFNTKIGDNVDKDINKSEWPTSFKTRFE